MAAHLTGSYSAGLRHGGKSIYSSAPGRLRGDTLHGLKSRANGILTGLRTTHIRLKTLKKLVRSRVGSEIVFGTGPSGTSGLSHSLLFGVHDRFQVRSF